MLCVCWGGGALIDHEEEIATWISEEQKRDISHNTEDGGEGVLKNSRTVMTSVKQAWEEDITIGAKAIRYVLGTLEKTTHFVPRYLGDKQQERNNIGWDVKCSSSVVYWWVQRAKTETKRLLR